MADNSPPGDGYRIGAVRGQSRNMTSSGHLGNARHQHWAVHVRENVDQDSFKDVRREK